MNKLIRILAAFAAIGAICLGLLGGGAGVGSAQTAQAYAFVLNEDGDSISVLDPTTKSVMTTHNLKGTLSKPHLAAYDAATKRLYVGNKGSNLVVFDMSDVMAPRTVANIKPGGNGEIHRVVLAGGLVWLAHEGDSTVYAYDLNDFSAPRVRLGKEQGFDTVHGLGVRPGTNELWVTNRPTRAPGFLLRIDLQSRSVIGRPLLTTGKEADRPNNVEFTSDGKWAYVVNTGSKATEVTVVDAEKFQVAKQLVQEERVGLAPHAIAYYPPMGRMFVVNKDSPTITVIATSSQSILGYFSIGAEPHGITLGPDGMMYATAKRGNKVYVFDPRALSVTREIEGFVGPHQIVFTAAYQPPMPTATAEPPTNTPEPPAATAVPATPTPEPAPPVSAPVQIEASTTSNGAAAQSPGMPRTGVAIELLFLMLPALLLLFGVGVGLRAVSLRC